MDTDMGTGGHSSKRLRGDSAASHAHQSGLHTNRVDASSGQGQSAVEQEAAIAQGQPPAKRPRTDSESSPGTSNATGIKLRVTPRPPPQATAAVSQPAPQATTAGSSTRKALPNFSKPQESSLSAVPAQSGGSDTQIGQVSSTNAPPPSTSAKTAAKVGKTGSEASLNKPSAPSQAQSATKSAPSRSNTPNRALGQAARPPNQQQPAKKSSETLNDLLGRKTAAPSKPIPSSDTRPGTPRGSAAGGPSSVKISAVEEVSKTSADAQSKKEETTTEAPPAEPAQSQDGDSQESSQGKDSNKRKRDNKAEALFGQKIKKGNNPLASVWVLSFVIPLHHSFHCDLKLKMTKSGSNTQPVPEAGPSQPQPVLLHQFNQNKRQA